jgi:hypothetical protein
MKSKRFLSGKKSMKKSRAKLRIVVNNGSVTPIPKLEREPHCL